MSDQVRRCAVLFLEPREQIEFDLALLFEGESGLRSELTWVALAPHLAREVEVDAWERELLGSVGETTWMARASLEATHGEAVITTLLAKGLLISDNEDGRLQRERDDTIRAAFWKPLSAAAHFFSRWEDVDARATLPDNAVQSTAELVERYGAAPAHFHTREDATQRVPLRRPQPGSFERLLQRRATCRNFDPDRAVDADRFARLLHAVFAAQAAVALTPDASALKKTSPSGGGLHATSAYLLVQRVDGVPPGLYHYHCGEHTLELISTSDVRDSRAATLADAGAYITSQQLRSLANRCVAGQDWFADAHVLVALVPRFRRSFWKYRNHAKAYRALILDAGHLSQTLYLAATEMGLGAFITAAVNEVEIERAFGLDPLQESPIAVCGFGWRASERVTVEFDPMGEVWTSG